MKKLIGIFVTAAMAILLGTCASAEQPAVTGISLDAAITEAARDITGKLPAGTRVAIVHFESETEQLSNYIMEELTGALVNSKLDVADRNNLEFIRKELNLHLSGEVDDASAQSIGKFLGAQTVITGQFINAGDRYRFRVNAITVETAKLESSTRLDVAATRELKNFIAALNSREVSSRVARAERTPESAGDFLDEGYGFFDADDFESAVEAFSQAIDLDPAIPAAYFFRGRSYTELEEYDLAIEDFTESITLDPEDGEAYYYRGDAYLVIEDYDRAIADFNRAIKLDTDNGDIYYTSRGQAYAEKKNYDQAIADCSQAINLNPDFALAYYLRAAVYEAKGQGDLARRDLEKAVRLAPEFLMTEDIYE